MTKKTLSRVCLSEIAANGVAPSEIRIFKLGVNDTTHGPLLLDAKGGAEVLKRFVAYANDLSIDYEHDTFNPLSSGPKPAAGWVTQGGLEMRADGLYAKVAWTERAKQAIEAREYRYFSPTVCTESSDAGERMVELLPIALTNFPATIGMQPLVAKAKQTMTKIYAASLTMIVAAVEQACVGAYPGATGIVVLEDGTVQYDSEGKRWSEGWTYDGQAATLGGSPTELATASGSPAAPPAGDVPATEAQAAALGRALMMLTGLSCLKVQEQVKFWRDQVAEASKKLLSAERTSLIEKASREGRLTAHLRRLAEGTQDVGELRRWLSALPVIPAFGPPTVEPPASTTRNLTKDADMGVGERIHQMAVNSPEQFNEWKKENRGR